MKLGLVKDFPITLINLLDNRLLFAIGFRPPDRPRTHMDFDVGFGL